MWYCPKMSEVVCSLKTARWVASCSNADPLPALSDYAGSSLKINLIFPCSDEHTSENLSDYGNSLTNAENNSEYLPDCWAKSPWLHDANVGSSVNEQGVNESFKLEWFCEVLYKSTTLVSRSEYRAFQEINHPVLQPISFTQAVEMQDLIVCVLFLGFFGQRTDFLKVTQS